MPSDKERQEPWFYRKAAELGEWWRKGHPPIAPSIDRRWVRDRYQQAIWPVLKDHGFDKFHDCGAWRHGDRRIDVIYLRFFPKPDTMKWGVTPFSFALEAGVYFPFIPPVNPLKIKADDGEMLPQEVDCHIRRDSIERGFKQRKNRIPNIWCVEPDGSNIEEILEDGRTQLIEQALSWFGRLDDVRYVSELLTRTQRTAFRGDLELDAWGISSYTPGFLALELGQWQSAAELLQKALDSGAFSPAEYRRSSRSTVKTIAHAEYLESQMRAAIEKARSELAGQEG
jgi:hypothetical protein